MAEFEVRSEIAGVVRTIEAAVGSTLERDGTLLVLESMKMEIPVAAPADCTLIEILVAEEGMVEEGQAVAIVEPD